MDDFSLDGLTIMPSIPNYAMSLIISPSLLVIAAILPFLISLPAIHQ